ncbi:hypothetical protein [Priestia flexa]|uniref:hypothetical protein n=1 Tax=Priestia flexa TaxID=86664 RepID=UPI001FF79384|nr:hypothetical protein [Priestia flexa]
MSKANVKGNFAFEVLCGITETASTLGYDLILFNTNTTKQREKTYVQLCRKRRVDGVRLYRELERKIPILKKY